MFGISACPLDVLDEQEALSFPDRATCVDKITYQVWKTASTQHMMKGKWGEERESKKKQKRIKFALKVVSDRTERRRCRASASAQRVSVTSQKCCSFERWRHVGWMGLQHAPLKFFMSLRYNQTTPQ